MKVIDGEKYVSEKEFDSAVKKCIAEMSSELGSKEDKDPMFGVLIGMLVMTEFGTLSQTLFSGGRDANR